MPSTPSSPTADRNLLFGVLALQLNFVTRDALVEAMHAWVLDKTKPLGQILLDQGRLTAGQFQALERLLGEHIQAHGTPLDSLRSLAPGSEVRSAIDSLDDPDLLTCLLAVSPTGDGIPSAREGGRYRVLRPHARGGLGDVFLAEDTELHREVALKEIQEQYADDPARRHRFILEAEVTGGLEHPGIVPVYGLGVYRDGRPHYAMRFIRGKSLRQEIDDFHAADGPARDPGERRLAFRALLGRFIDVCNAIAYAHSRGVLHRDLKPANVMLGRFGETLVVDWGLAKPGVESRAEGEAADVTVEPALRPASGSEADGTRAGAVMGTPAFMSPEQAAGLLDEMGPASDIYSLGSMLYVLLTGKKPYGGSVVHDVLAQVRSGQFLPPRQVKADTPAPLDAVCLEAMAFSPRDRYASAELLAADLEHWLADEPVSAYPEPLPARLRRWARRHRTAVAAGVVFLTCAVAGLSASTTLVWREQQNTAAEKRRAEENYELARERSFESIRLLEAAAVPIASDPQLLAMRKKVLSDAARAFRHYLAQQPDDPALRERTVDVFRYAANAHRLVRELDEAEPLYADAIGLLEGLAAEFPEEADYRRKLSETLRDYAAIEAQRGRLSKAADSLRRAVALSEALQEIGGPPSLDLCAALLDLSANEYTRGDIAESGKRAARAAALFHERTQLPAGPRHPYDPLLYASAMNLVAATAREEKRYKVSRNAHDRAVNTLNKMYQHKGGGATPDDVLSTLGGCLIELARSQARVDLSRPAAVGNLIAFEVHWQGLALRHPKIAAYREQHAVGLQVQGEIRAMMKRPAEAQADFDAAQKLLEVVIQESPDLPSPQGHLGRVYLELARLARKKEDDAGASAWLRRADETLRRALELSPEDAQNRRSLKEVGAERTPK